MVWMDGWMDGWMNGWTDGWMEGGREGEREREREREADGLEGEDDSNHKTATATMVTIKTIIVRARACPLELRW